MKQDCSQYLERLTRGMKRLPYRTSELPATVEGFNREGPVLLGDRRQREYLPILALQYMTDQVIPHAGAALSE